MVKYRTELFDARTVETLGERLRAILQAVARAPRGRISQIETVLSAERARLLGAWLPVAARPQDAPDTVHRAFEAQAARTPHATALKSGADHLTYRELDARADALAHRLTALGVGAETPVGILMRRSPEVVVAMLAVLKAGGAYVPLHTSYPAARIERILDNAGFARCCWSTRSSGRSSRAAPVPSS